MRRLRHPNIISLVDVYAKMEDADGHAEKFPWFATIEQEPLFWTYSDGTEEQKMAKLVKWYLIFQFCPCSLQTLLDQSDDRKLPVTEAHRYFLPRV